MMKVEVWYGEKEAFFMRMRQHTRGSHHKATTHPFYFLRFNVWLHSTLFPHGFTVQNTLKLLWKTVNL